MNISINNISGKFVTFAEFVQYAKEHMNLPAGNFNYYGKTAIYDNDGSFKIVDTNGDVIFFTPSDALFIDGSKIIVLTKMEYEGVLKLVNAYN